MNYARAAKNWGHVAVRAAGYGAVSCSIGAVAPTKRVSRWCMRRWSAGAADGLRIRRKLINGHRLDGAPQCVIVANHLSLLDILVIGSFLRRDYRWLAKSSVFQVPFLGWHLTVSGHVPVHRRHPNRNPELFAQIHSVVGEGANLLFFPEGTRSPDGNLQSFKIGAFMTAIREELPVLPLVLRGTGDLLVKGAMDLAVIPNRECSVTVLPLIDLTDGSAAGAAKARAEALRDRTRAAFLGELGREG